LERHREPAAADRDRAGLRADLVASDRAVTAERADAEERGAGHEAGAPVPEKSQRSRAELRGQGPCEYRHGRGERELTLKAEGAAGGGGGQGGCSRSEGFGSA